MPERSRRAALMGQLTRLGDPPVAELLAHLGRLTDERGLAYTSDAGRQRLVPAMPPVLWDARGARYLNGVLERILERILSVIWSRPHETDARRLFPLDPQEERTLRRVLMRTAGLPSFCFPRLDCVAPLDADDWPWQAKIVEANLSVVGGVCLSVLCEQVALGAMARMGRRRGRRVDVGGMALGPNPDVRDLFYRSVLDYGRALGLRAPVRLALVEDLRLPAGEDPMRPLARHLSGRGWPVVAGDVRDVHLEDGRLELAGEPVDLVYRYLELRDALELEDAHEPVDGFMAAFETGRVIPLVETDLDHKAVLDPLTDPSSPACLPASLRRHVAWTRLLTERRTTDPTGRDVDLPSYAERNRRGLVIKPNRGFGGNGVILGHVSQARLWREALGEALAQSGGWVIQERAGPYMLEVLVSPEDGDRQTRAVCPVLGFYVTPTGMGVLGRASGEAVVNVSRGGTLLPVLRRL